MTLRRLALAACALVLMLGRAPPAAAAADIPAIAAAADLQFALTELAEGFGRQTGKSVKLVFGSSGGFFRQIKEGAPFELFLSADESYAFDLAQDGLTRGQGVLYAVGRIALMVPAGSALKADGSLKDLAAALDAGLVKKFAIANPDHAPYGRAAREALKTAGLWDKIQDRLVLGENVSQAAHYATTGAAAGGIIAYSLALSPKVAALGRSALIPEGWHAPLRQRMVLTSKAGETAAAFYGYIQSPAARAVFKAHGFVLPGEM